MPPIVNNDVIVLACIGAKTSTDGVRFLTRQSGSRDTDFMLWRYVISPYYGMTSYGVFRVGPLDAVVAELVECGAQDTMHVGSKPDRFNSGIASLLDVTPRLHFLGFASTEAK